MKKLLNLSERRNSKKTQITNLLEKSLTDKDEAKEIMVK